MRVQKRNVLVFVVWMWLIGVIGGRGSFIAWVFRQRACLTIECELGVRVLIVRMHGYNIVS